MVLRKSSAVTSEKKLNFLQAVYVYTSMACFIFFVPFIYLFSIILYLNCVLYKAFLKPTFLFEVIFKSCKEPNNMVAFNRPGVCIWSYTCFKIC